MGWLETFSDRQSLLQRDKMSTRWYHRGKINRAVRFTQPINMRFVSIRIIWQHICDIVARCCLIGSHRKPWSLGILLTNGAFQTVAFLHFIWEIGSRWYRYVVLCFFWRNSRVFCACFKNQLHSFLDAYSNYDDHTFICRELSSHSLKLVESIHSQFFFDLTASKTLGQLGLINSWIAQWLKIETSKVLSPSRAECPLFWMITCHSS